MYNNGLDARAADAEWAEDDGAGSELWEYWQVIRPCWKRIAACSLAAAAVTALLVVFVLPRIYKASAVLRPASQESATQQAVTVGASGILGNVGASVSSALGLGSSSNDAQEFMVILTSDEFTIHLIDKYQLKYHILPPSFFKRVKQRYLGIDPYTPWRQYLKMQKLFDVDYDSQTGNLTLTFSDSDPAMARKILGYYIHELRELLRQRAIHVASVAVNSLQRQITQTSDALLIQQLDQLAAEQLQFQLTAEMQADFAFTVDDPPTTPEFPDSPWFFIDPLVAALLTPFLCAFWLILMHRLRKFRHAMESVDSAPRPTQAKVPLEADESAQAERSRHG
jgi:uncharacterized protein involved in exopolysaccharide biosynthesis